MSEPPRILIADDLPVNRTLLEHFLKKFGECSFAANGLEVVEAFEQGHANDKPIDLVMLDIMMPEMDGQEALHLIRAKEKKMGLRQKDELKAIMITSLSDWDNVLAGFKKGVVEYIVKPIKEPQLVSTLNKMGYVALT